MTGLRFLLPPPLHRHEIQLNGLYRLSEAEKIFPCKITNLKTGETTTSVPESAILKTEFDKDYKKEVWKWINKVSPTIKISGSGIMTSFQD
jgi:hypothetical protein